MNNRSVLGWFMFNKSIQTGSVGNIQFINGFVRYRNIFQLNVYSYVVDGVMIDTGANSLFHLFRTYFDEADIDQVRITHHHEDHTGGAHYIATTKKVPIYIHKDSVGISSKKADYPLYRKIFWGERKPFPALPMEESFTSRNATWEVIETPGHMQDHLSFLNRETGQLFTGDLYVAPKLKVILRTESVPQTARSIERVLSYDFEEVVCNHAGIVPNGREMLMKKLNYLNDLMDKVLTLRQKGMSVKEIHHSLFNSKYPIQLFSLGEWHSIHIITSILNECEVQVGGR